MTFEINGLFGEQAATLSETQKTPELKKDDPEKLKSACQDFEALLLNMMMKQMKDSIPKSGLLGDSYGSKMYDSMFYEELTKNIAHGKNNLGIGDYLYNELTRNKEK